jgi:hypothetical protein
MFTLYLQPSLSIGGWTKLSYGARSSKGGNFQREAFFFLAFSSKARLMPLSIAMRSPQRLTFRRTKKGGNFQREAFFFAAFSSKARLMPSRIAMRSSRRVTLAIDRYSSIALSVFLDSLLDVWIFSISLEVSPKLSSLSAHICAVT